MEYNLQTAMNDPLHSNPQSENEMWRQTGVAIYFIIQVVKFEEESQIRDKEKYSNDYSEFNCFRFGIEEEYLGRRMSKMTDKMVLVMLAK